METPIRITSPRDERVFIRVTHGHFVTSHAHINHYVGTSDIKHNHIVSTEAAALLAEYYTTRGIEVDTVLCLYETQTLGAYLAHELARPSMMSPNPNPNIYVLGAEYDMQGNIIFRDNLQRMIKEQRVVVLMSCITSGKTIERAIESVGYYGGSVVGISAAFSATKYINGIEVNCIFDEDDLPNYEAYDVRSCPLCKQGLPVDALANGYGYSKL